MEKLLEKISAYQILNYIIPGVAFLYFVDILNIYDVYENNTLAMLFEGYCLGMIFSRIGSLLIEPLLKKCKIIIFAPYPDFLEAQNKDSKISELSTENNTYRTFLSMFFIVLILYGLNFIPCVRVFLRSRWMWLVVLVLVVVLFLLAYRKQTAYVRQRVNRALGES